MNERTLGPYVLHSSLGKGGMGEVYRAVDKRTTRLVAVKLLAPALAGDAALVARFAQEQAVLASLDHPHIVKSLSMLEQYDGTWCFAMAYVPSINLAMLLKGMGRLTAANAAALAAQVLSALAFAHAKGIVHRDVKPQNLLVDRAGRVHVTDFGLARAEDLTRLTLSGQLLGTPEYMSPEQAEGGSPDARSDLYSLGVVLYQALTGEAPFKGNHPLAVLKMHTEAPFPPSPHLPAELEPIVRRAMEKSPGARFASAEEMRKAVVAACPSAETATVAVSGFPLEALTADTFTEVRAPRRRWGWVAVWLTLLFLFGLGVWVWNGTGSPPPHRWARVTVTGIPHEGDIIEIKGGRVRLRLPNGQEDSFPLDQVDRIEYR